MMSEKTRKKIETKFLRADWTTQQLFEKLIKAAPSLNGVNFTNNSVLKQHRLTEFEMKCYFISPVGGGIANYCQLDA